MHIATEAAGWTFFAVVAAFLGFVAHVGLLGGV